MRHLIILVAAALSLSWPDQPQKMEQGHYMVYGAGGASCGTWLADHREGSHLYFVNSAWVAGFVSAVGWTGDQLKKTDPNALDAWIDQYCTANPLSTINEAAVALSKELAKK